LVIPTYFELIKTCLFEMGDCVKPSKDIISL